MTGAGDSPRLRETVDEIESAYEFMLAYAAQGRDDDPTPGDGGIRGFLERLRRALEAVESAAEAEVAARQPELTELYAPLLALLRRDAADALSKIRVVAAQRGISSQLIDNLNASIHLRALLTDLFVIDEALRRS